MKHFQYHILTSTCVTIHLFSNVFCLLAYEGWESIVEEKKRELKGVIQESKKEDCNLEAASQKLERDVHSAIAVGLPRTIMYQKKSLVSAKWFSSRAKKDLWNALSKLLNAHNEFQKGIFSSPRPIVLRRYFLNVIDTDLKDVPW